LIFTKDEKGKIVVILKYVTTSYTYNILEIEDIVSTEDLMIQIKYSPLCNMKNENFRTNEVKNIIKIFKELKTKAYKIVDEKRAQNEEKKKNKELQNILNKQLFG
jgi:hypothetical protein